MSEDQLRAELECAKQEVAELRAKLSAAEEERDTCLTDTHDTIASLRAKLSAAEEQSAEFKAVFDTRWEATMRAIKCWQAAHPGNDRVWPDHADLCVWLMDQLTAAEARAEKAEAERDKLAAFAREIIRVECWGYQPEIDGGDVQDVAEKLGLIEACIATEADAATMNDVCVGDCSFLLLYRFAPWLSKITLTQEQDNG